MELDSIEIISCIGEGSYADPPLTIRLSQSSAPSEQPFDSTSLPSVVASVDSSSSSISGEATPFESTKHDFSKSQQAPNDNTDTPESMDFGCMTDRVVRFFCPFDAPQTSNNRKDSETEQSTQCDPSFMVSNMTEVPPTIRDCASSGGWLQPVQVCIPEHWEGSPPRVTLGKKNKLKIRNRCSALEATGRKSVHVQKLHSQWHSQTDPIPMKASRSTAHPTTGCSSHHHQAREEETASNTFYDSEPEVVPRYRTKRPPSLQLQSLQGESTSERPRILRHSSSHFGSFFESPKSVTDLPVPDLNNDEATRAYIRVAAEQKYNLVWHQPPCRRETAPTTTQPPQSAPVAVIGWFEYGSQLDNHVVFPKFVWRQTLQSGLRNIIREPNQVMLLSVVSALKPTKLNRAKYPFARLDRSCCIVTHDGQEYVFEASCPQARDVFVDRMKVIVARLASSVIVKDEAMLQEFFMSASDDFDQSSALDGNYDNNDTDNAASSDERAWLPR